MIMYVYMYVNVSFIYYANDIYYIYTHTARIRIFEYIIYLNIVRILACGHISPGCGRPTPVSDVFWTSTTIFNLGANQLLCCNRMRLSARGDHVCRLYFQTVCPVLALELKARHYSID